MALRMKMRTKLILFTAFFTASFLFSLLFFTRQELEKYLVKSGLQQAENIYSSLQGTLDYFAQTSGNLDRAREETAGGAKVSPKKRADALKKAGKKADEAAKALSTLFSSPPDQYQMTFIRKDWLLLSHSHPENLSASRIGSKLYPRTRKNFRYRVHRRIFAQYKDFLKSGRIFHPARQTLLNVRDGYFSLINPVFSDPGLAEKAEWIGRITAGESGGLHPVMRDLFNNRDLRKFQSSLTAIEKSGTDAWKNLNRLKNLPQNRKLKEAEFRALPEVSALNRDLRGATSRMKKKVRELAQLCDIWFKARLSRLKTSIDYRKSRNATADQENVQFLILQKLKLEGTRKAVKAAFRGYPFSPDETRDALSLPRGVMTPDRAAGRVLGDLFFGLAEVRMFLEARITDRDRMTFRLTDTGLSFFLRGIFLVFVFSGFFVRDIKSLERTAEKVRRGNLDEKFSVESGDEIKSLADTFNNMLGGLRERESLLSEIQTASEIQRNLLPQKDELRKLTGFDVEFFYRPMKGVGGDCVDFFSTDEESWLLIADVSNHGIGPGLVMTMMRAALRTMAENRMPLSSIITSLNVRLYRDTPPEIFVTLLLMKIRPNGSVQYACCGHNPPFRLGGGAATMLEGGGMAIGAMMPEIFNSTVRISEIKVKKGDFLFLYTDGLTEASDRTGGLLGEERLQSLLNRMAGAEKLNSRSVLHNCIRMLENHTGEKMEDGSVSELDDDIAMICLGWK